MNRDELIAIAKEAGIWIPADADCETFITTIDELTKFAALIAEPLEDEIAELKSEVKAYQDEQVAYTMKVVVERTELQAHINRLLKHIKEDI